MTHLQRYSRLTRAAAVILIAAGLAAACASPPAKPETMRDPQANFTSFKTFGWSDAGNGEPVKILDSQLRTAIAAELQRRGYAQAAPGATPDLRITYEAAAQEKLQNNPVRIGVGIGSYGSNGGGSVGVGSSSVKNVREGSLVIHAIDSARNAEVWQGRYAANIGKGSVDQARINKAVAMAMQDFPAH